MTTNYKGELSCLQCIFDHVDSELNAQKRIKCESALWNKKDDLSIYKDYSRSEFEHSKIDNSNEKQFRGKFIAQTGDEVYLIWQGYEHSI